MFINVVSGLKKVNQEVNYRRITLMVGRSTFSINSTGVTDSAGLSIIEAQQK